MISEDSFKTPVLLFLQQLQFKVDHSISCHQLPFSNPSRDYVISYDKRNRTAHWVFEHLTKASVARNEEVDRQKSSFIEDEAIHPFFRSTNADYKVNTFFQNFSLLYTKIDFVHSLLIFACIHFIRSSQWAMGHSSVLTCWVFRWIIPPQDF